MSMSVCVCVWVDVCVGVCVCVCVCVLLPIFFLIFSSLDGALSARSVAVASNNEGKIDKKKN